MTNCHISVIHCTSQTMTIVWKVNKNKPCSMSMNLGTHNILLHYNTSSLYRVEITTLGMPVHQWSVCAIRAIHCFPKQLFCTFNGICLVIFNRNELSKLPAFKPSKSLGELAKAHPDTPFAPLLNKIEDQLSDLIQKLDEQSRLLNCQLERALSIIANTAGKLFPSEILSLATGHPTLGIAAGSVITGMDCTTVIGTVLPSLDFGNNQKFSLLPLVQSDYKQNGNSRLGQLVSPNYIIQGEPTYYETYHPSRTLIFKVNSRYILYENYTASHYLLNVAPLHIPLSTFTVMRTLLRLTFPQHSTSLQKIKMD